MHNTATLNSFALPRYKCTHFLNVSCFFFMSQIREQKLRVISSVVFFSPQKFYDTAPVHFDSYIAPFQTKG